MNSITELIHLIDRTQRKLDLFGQFCIFTIIVWTLGLIAMFLFNHYCIDLPLQKIQSDLHHQLFDH